MGYLKGTPVSRTGSGVVVTGPCEIDALALLAGSDAATVIFRDGGPQGPPVWPLVAATGLSASETFSNCIRCETALWADTTGTSPKVTAIIQNPAPNQITPANNAY